MHQFDLRGIVAKDILGSFELSWEIYDMSKFVLMVYGIIINAYRYYSAYKVYLLTSSKYDITAARIPTS